MWKCPKCGRTFCNDNQHHFCGKCKGPKTIDEYIDEQGEDIRPQLEQVRNAIREVLSEATEKIAWQMPTYREKKNIIHFAASKNHIGLYPGEAVVAHLSNILDEYGFKYAKGSIQIPYTAEVPKDLIKQIAGWAKSNIE